MTIVFQTFLNRSSLSRSDGNPVRFYSSDMAIQLWIGVFNHSAFLSHGILDVFFAEFLAREILLTRVDDAQRFSVGTG